MLKLFYTLFFVCNFAFANEVNFPKLTSPVMDTANYLTKEETQVLDQKIRNYYENGGPQIQILTVNNLQGLPIEDYSIKLLEEWKLGNKREGNGLLILVSKEERKLRIEVGEGIEDKVTDYDASIILRKKLIPNFKAENYFKAFDETIEALNHLNSKEEGPRSLIERRKMVYNIPSNFVVPLFYGAFFLYLVGLHYFRKKRIIKGIFSGVFFALTSYLIFEVVAFVIAGALFGLFIGLVGPSHFLRFTTYHNYRRGAGFGGFRGGGGGPWSGGGGGFSGGGSSGSF